METNQFPGMNFERNFMETTQFPERNIMAAIKFYERNVMVTGNHTHQYEQDNPQALVPHALVDDETISPQAKAVHLVLARHADGEGRVTSVPKGLLARKCGYSKADSVDRYLNELRGKGWLTWRRPPRGGRGPATNLYVVHGFQEEGK